MSANEFTIDDLLAEAGWTERLARALAQDAAGAQDLVQDVWARALAHAPSADRPARPWLRRVLTNLFVSRHREGTRRIHREQQAAAIANEVPTPEELVARMEAHRILAESLAALEEPYRQTLILCYHGGLEPAEIASRLGLPGGTVRRRLKEGRDRLRRRLEERHGDPRRWLAAFAPAVMRKRPQAEAAAAAPRRSAGEAMPPARRVPVPAMVGVSTALLLGGVLFWRAIETRSPSSPGVVGFGRTGHGDRGPKPGSSRFALVATKAETSCPEVGPLREEISTLAAALEPFRGLRKLFDESVANPGAEAVLVPIVDSAYVGVPVGCGHSISCRGRVCEFVTLVPRGTRREVCEPTRPERVLEDRLAVLFNNLYLVPEIVWDATLRRRIERWRTWVRLEREDAATVPVDQRVRPSFLYDISKPVPSRPARLPENCRELWDTLAARLARLRAEALERFPNAAFAQGPPAPDLERRFEAWARKVLPQPEGALPFSVSCRGTTCVLTPRTPESATDALKRACTKGPDGHERCTIDPSTWVGRLSRHEIARAVGRLEPPRRGPDGTMTPMRFRLKTELERRGAAALTWFVGLVHGFDWKGEIKTCEVRHPSRGSLLVKIILPSKEPITAQERPEASLVLTGDLTDTPIAACVHTAFERASKAADAPPVAEGRAYDVELDFPFDPTALERRWTEWKELDAQRAKVPPL